MARRAGPGAGNQAPGPLRPGPRPSVRSSLFFIAPSLLAPLAGALVDRLSRRPLLIAVNLYGASATVLSAGGSAMLTMLFASDELGAANSYLSAVSEGCRLFAPLAGAGRFTIIGGAALGLIDAASFLVAAASLATITVREAVAVPRAQPAWRSYMAAGVRHLLASAPLRQMTVAVALTLLFAGLLESIAFAVVSEGLHRAPAFLGVLVSAQGAGALAGALVATAVMGRIGPGGLISAGLGLVAVSVLTLMAPALVIVLTGFVLAGVGVPWLVLGFGTAIQRLTPMAPQGRVDAAAGFLIGTPQAVSIAVGAALVTVVDYRILLAIIAAVFAAAGLGLVSRSQQRPAFIDAAAAAVTDLAGASG